MLASKRAVEFGNGREDRPEFDREDGWDAIGAEQRTMSVVELAVDG